VLRCGFAWRRPSIHPFALPLILSACSPFIVRPRPVTFVRERAQIGLLKLSPACPRETPCRRRAELVHSTAKVDNKAAATKRTDPPPASEVDSIFSLRDDEAGGVFKSTRDADDDHNDNDESRRTNETPKGDDGDSAFDRQRQSKAAPAEAPAPTPRPEERLLLEASINGKRWSTATRSIARATTKAREDEDDDEKGGSVHKRPRDDKAGARLTGSEKVTAPSGNPSARCPMPDTRCPKEMKVRPAREHGNSFIHESLYVLSSRAVFYPHGQVSYPHGYPHGLGL
jgi:hypothetical protein